MVKHFVETRKPIAAICHGAQLLAAAGETVPHGGLAQRERSCLSCKRQVMWQPRLSAFLPFACQIQPACRSSTLRHASRAPARTQPPLLPPRRTAQAACRAARAPPTLLAGQRCRQRAASCEMLMHRKWWWTATW